MAKIELLENMRVERMRLMEAIGEVRVELADMPCSPGDWSMKDLIAHMAAWEEEALQRLLLIKDGRGREIRYIQDEELDRWNAQAVAVRQSLSWEQVLIEFSAVRERLLETIEDISEEQLADEVGEVPVAHWLANSTYSHDEEHLPDIVTWLRGRT